MATGQPGFTDSIFKLANQRQSVLAAEKARVERQNTFRANAIDDMSGFNASLIEGDEFKQIFEELSADTTAYITSTGKYEDEEYNPLELRKRIMSLGTQYDAMVGHNQGDVKLAQQRIYADAYAEGGTRVDTDENAVGTHTMTNNTPSSYEESVLAHNNYFKTARDQDGNVMYDENNQPLGYPVINGEVDERGMPTPIFKMEAYGNPAAFAGQTVEQPVETTLEIAQLSENVNTMAAISKSLTVAEIGDLDVRGQHDLVVTKFFDDKFSRPGASDFRETLLTDLIAEGKTSLSKEQEQSFINGEFENINTKVMALLREDSEKLYADRSFQRPEQEVVDWEDTPYQAVINKGGTSAMIAEEGIDAYLENTTSVDVGGEWQQNVFKDVIPVTGSVYSDSPEGYEIRAAGVDDEGRIQVQVRETTTVVDEMGTETETITLKDIEAGPRMEGMSREIYETLKLQDPQILQDLTNKRNAVGRDRELRLREQKTARADGLKAIKEQHPDISDERAEAAYDAGGVAELENRESEEAYSLEMDENLLEAKDILKLWNETPSMNRADLGFSNADVGYFNARLNDNSISTDPNVLEGTTVAQAAAMELKRKQANIERKAEIKKNNPAAVEGDLDGDGQLGYKEGDAGYDSERLGYNQYEGKDEFGDVVKGYEAFYAQLGPGDRTFYTEPEAHRLKREKRDGPKSKPIIPSNIDGVFTEEAIEETPEFINTATSVNTENVDASLPEETQATQILTDTLNLNVPEGELVDEIREMFANVLGSRSTSGEGNYFDDAVRTQNQEGNADPVPAWCAAFVSDLLLKADPDFKLEEGFARVRARTFLDVGEEVSTENNFSNAQLGDIVVKKGSGGYHVGVFAGVDKDGDVRIFGANQNDSVNISTYPAEQVQGVRRVEVQMLSKDQLEAISSVTNASKGESTR